MNKKYFFYGLLVVTGCLFFACQKIVTDVTLNKSILFLKPNQEEVLIATVHPKNATNKEVTWRSSDYSVAVVNSEGTVTACEKYGEATITVTTKDGNKLATCLVVVSDLNGEDDYRTKWIGSYDFTTIDIDNSDTVLFIGTIDRYQTNRLKIIFKTNATEPDFENTGAYSPHFNGIMYPIVDSLGNLTYPEFKSSLGGFGGSFSGNEISISYGGIGPLGMGAPMVGETIHGIKINKK